VTSLFNHSVAPAGSQFLDGSPGIKVCTTFTFQSSPGVGVAGVVDELWFYVGAQTGGTWTAVGWEVTTGDTGNAGAGTQVLNQAFSGSPVANSWNKVTIASPVAIPANANKRWRFGIHNTQYYWTNNGFYNAHDEVNAPVYALRSGDTTSSTLGLINNGTFAIGSSTTSYPQQTGSQANYGIDINFTASSSTTPVSSSLDLRWTSRGQVSQSTDLRWASRAQVSGSLDLRWASRQAISSSLDLRWASLNAVSAQMDLRWAVRNLVSNNLDVRWTSRQQVSNSLDMRWDSASGGATPVSASLDLRWATLNAVAASLDVRWAVRQAISASLDLRWAQLASVAAPLDLRWTSRGQVASSIDLQWATRQAVGSTLDLRWAVRNQISAILDMPWTVRALVVAPLQLIWVVEGAPLSGIPKPSVGTATLTQQITSYPESITAYL
jgi:hypothetical protein